MDKTHSGDIYTDGIHVQVDPFYLADESDPSQNHFFWGYRVRIRNDRRETVKLTARFWRIVDCQGSVQEIKGTGVVGEQPVLAPGETYGYASGATMTRPSGIMEGHYVMVTEAGETLKVQIPAFSLDSPHGDTTRH